MRYYREIRQRGVSAWLVFAATFVAYLAAGHWVWQSNDALSAELQAFSIGVNHSIAVHNVAHPYELWMVPGHGGLVSNRFPGIVLFMVPFYALIGGAKPVLAVGVVAAALLGAAAVAMLYRALRALWINSAVALLAVTVFAFGTGMWAVAGAEPLEESGACLCLAVAMYAMTTLRHTTAAIAVAVGVLFRPHLALCALIVAIALYRSACVRGDAIALVGGAGLGGLLYEAWNVLLYGHVSLFGGYGEATTFTGRQSYLVHVVGVGPENFVVNIFGMLLSPGRGLLVWTPVLLLAVIGGRAAWNQVGSVQRSFALGGLVYLLVQCYLIRFTGGDGFATYRIPLEALVMAAPLLVEAVQIGAHRVGEWALWFTIVVGIVQVAAVSLAGAELPGLGNDAWDFANLTRSIEANPLGAVLGVYLVVSVTAAVALVRWRKPKASLYSFREGVILYARNSS